MQKSLPVFGKKIDKKHSAKTTDPRYFQIACLGSLIFYGSIYSGIDITWQRLLVFLVTSLVIQWIGTKVFKLPKFEPRSAIITALSLALLFRAGSWYMVVLAAILAIASKFILRYKNKHIFNPSLFGIATLLLVAPNVWVSSGQWGSDSLLLFIIVCAGGMVLIRSLRSDITLVFLGSYFSILVVRSLWLDEPLSIPLHQLQNGALMLFGFFMISDPPTTPNSKTGRVIFAILVAISAYCIRFILYIPNDLLWALFLLSPITALIDRLIPAETFNWNEDSKKT